MDDPDMSKTSFNHMYFPAIIQQMYNVYMPHSFSCYIILPIFFLNLHFVFSILFKDNVKIFVETLPTLILLSNFIAQDAWRTILSIQQKKKIMELLNIILQSMNFTIQYHSHLQWPMQHFTLFILCCCFVYLRIGRRRM